MFTSYDKDGAKPWGGASSYNYPPLSGDEFRVVSYNLLFEYSVPSIEAQQWSRRFEVVKQMFNEGSFDIVGTQEALTFQVNQIAEMGDYGRIGGDLATSGTDNLRTENVAVFYIFNSHFHAGDFLQSRIESAKIVLARVKEIAGDYPVFSVGDFNDIVSSEPLQVLLGENVLYDTYTLAKEKTGSIGTFHGFSTGQAPVNRINYVLVK